MKVGIIGCGNISEIYFKCQNIYNNFEIVACADIKLEAAKKNAEKLEVVNFVQLINLDVKNLTKSDIRYEIAFLDPPYFSELPELTINILSENGWLKKNQ